MPRVYPQRALAARDKPAHPLAWAVRTINARPALPPAGPAPSPRRCHAPSGRPSNGSSAPTDLTRCSLGGHLATAFKLLHPGAAQQVVTFNGAGVGVIDAQTPGFLSRAGKVANAVTPANSTNSAQWRPCA